VYVLPNIFRIILNLALLAGIEEMVYSTTCTSKNAAAASYKENFRSATSLLTTCPLSKSTSWSRIATFECCGDCKFSQDSHFAFFYSLVRINIDGQQNTRYSMNPLGTGF
jgi:hypothetical protein